MVIVQNLTSNTLELENGVTYYKKTLVGLAPYTLYGVNVRYVNSAGKGPNMTNLFQFRTDEGSKRFLLHVINNENYY